MKRFTLASSSALAALLLCSVASAQGNSGNQNDLRLENEGDFLYVYDDPSIGPQVGTSGVADFATNTYVYRTFSRDTLRHCSGAMEITSFDFFDFDTDWAIVDANGNNTALADWFVGAVDPAGPQSPTGTFEPDQANGTLFSFGNAATPGINNVFVTDPGCPTVANTIRGFEFQIDITGGLGAGNGLPITANGATDLEYTVFIPGGGQTITGANSCVTSGLGDQSLCDLHSSSNNSPTEGETQFDLIGGGTASAFGGFGTLGAAAGTDGVSETYCAFAQYTEPTLAMVVRSNVGHVDPGPAAGVALSNPDVQLEEGLAAVHYDCPPAAGGKLSARLYAWQGLGRPAAVIGTIAAPLASCLTFKGDKLGVSPTDPLFKVFLSLWQGTVIATDNQYAVPTGTNFDDHVFNALALPLPAQLIPVGVTIPLSFQGFYKKTSGQVSGSQVTRLFLHG